MYRPSEAVLQAHAIPHLSPKTLTAQAATFDPTSSSYLYSLLPLPVIIGGVGLISVLLFLIGIGLRLLLLCGKAIIRKCCYCIPGAEHCHIFRCCKCCKKHGGIEKHKGDEAASSSSEEEEEEEEQAEAKGGCCYGKGCCKKVDEVLTTHSTKLREHNKTRCHIMYTYAVLLVFVVIADGCVFIGSNELTKAMSSLVDAVHIVIAIFTDVVAATVQMLADIKAISLDLVTAPCNPFVPQSALDSITDYLNVLTLASNDIKSFASPIIDSLESFIHYVQGTLLPTKDFFIYCFFAGLAFIALVFGLGEYFQSRLLMRFSLLLSAAIVLGLTCVCTLAMVLVMVLGDFCVNPALNILSLIDNKSSLLYRELSYFITCQGKNPFQSSLDTAAQTNDALCSTVNSFAPYVSPSCITELQLSTTSFSKSTSKIASLLECHGIYSFFDKAINEALCTSGFLGFYDLWITFFVCSSLLFFAMVAAYVFYTWYLEIDVIGIGWFEDDGNGEVDKVDEDDEDEEEAKQRASILEVDYVYDEHNSERLRQKRKEKEKGKNKDANTDKRVREESDVESSSLSSIDGSKLVLYLVEDEEDQGGL